MLGEAATTEIAQKRDIRGFEPNKKAASTAAMWPAMPARTLKSSRAERCFGRKLQGTPGKESEEAARTMKENTFYKKDSLRGNRMEKFFT